MAIPVEMPKMSDTMEEGVLVAWLANEGEQVASGDVIAQVETDKATMDLEVYDDGVLLKQMIEEGDSVPIGGLIAVLGKEGKDISGLLSKYEGTADAQRRETDGETGEAAKPVAEPAEEEKAMAPEGDGRIKTSPLARRLASEYGIDLSTIQGTGPEGRIVRRDVEAVAAEKPAEKAPPAAEPRPAAPRAAEPAPVPAPVAADRYEDRKISQMRKTISRRLAQSKFTAPHFYLTVDVDMDNAVDFRTRLNEVSQEKGGAKISFNDLITKACAVALRRHPQVNASYLENEGILRYYKDVHIAVAVAIDEGLVTPVVRDADRKGLGQIAAETRELAGRARERTLDPADWEGSTFTTSNLGMFGIEEFTAIINPPNTCILAIGALRDEPVVRDGEIVPGKRMKLTLSCDHRLVDGATGADFLTTVKDLLEQPLNMML
ncbi:MAG: pyruvate dehydrogenase complex dihydrolipoamide acetyltransferase [Bacteroidota bacterium]